MNAHLAHMINSFALILIGGYGFYVADSKVELISVFLGVILLSVSNGVQYGNKASLRIAIVLTLVVMIFLIKYPLMTAIYFRNTMNTIRVGIMVFTGTVTLGFFIKSQMEIRKYRKQKLNE